MRRNRHLKKKKFFTPSALSKSLKDFYTSTFREDDARPTPLRPVQTVVMPVPQFSIVIVHGELSSLDISKEAGADDICLHMIRCLADILAEPLSKLCANSLATAVAITDWHLAIICPIGKHLTQRAFPITAS